MVSKLKDDDRNKKVTNNKKTPSAVVPSVN